MGIVKHAKMNVSQKTKLIPIWRLNGFSGCQKKEKRIVRSEEKEITITMKEQTKGTVGNLLDLFTDQMVRFKIHSFNIGNQLKHYRLTKENLQENEALLHIDFAENFQTKLSREIQSMHFGASHSQITIPKEFTTTETIQPVLLRLYQTQWITASLQFGPIWSQFLTECKEKTHT